LLTFVGVLGKIVNDTPVVRSFGEPASVLIGPNLSPVFGLERIIAMIIATGSHSVLLCVAIRVVLRRSSFTENP
jgi:hypothetical protein